MILYTSLLLFGYLLALILIEDARYFEIKLEVLPFILCIGVYFSTYLDIHYYDIIFGGLLWGGVAFVQYFLKRSSIGQGDIWLYTTAGLIFTITATLSAAIFYAITSLITTLFYARARNKSLLKSATPAAIPMTIVLLLHTQWRFNTFGLEASQNSFWFICICFIPMAGFGMGFLHKGHKMWRCENAK